MRLLYLTLAAAASLVATLIALFMIDFVVGVIRHAAFQLNATAFQLNQTAAQRLAPAWRPLAPDIETLVSSVVPLVLVGLGVALFATYAHTRRR